MCLTLLGTVAASGSADSTSKEADAEQKNNDFAATSAVTDAADRYGYETPDLGGYTLRVLNSGDLWDMYMCVDVKETNGEVLIDTVYTWNRKVEEKLNCAFDGTWILFFNETMMQKNDLALARVAYYKEALSNSSAQDLNC